MKFKFSGEKLLLVFLLARPTIDLARDVSLFRVQGMNINLTTLWGGLFILWSLVYLFLYRKKLMTIPGKLFLGPLLLLSLVSVLYSIAPTQTLNEWIKMFSVFLCFGLSFVLVREEKITLKELFFTLLFSTFIPIVFGFYQFFFGIGITTFGIKDRIFGTFAHPNVFAFFLLFFFFIATHYFASSQKVFFKHDKVYITIGVLLLILLLFTYTRASWIGLMLFFFILTLSYSRKLFLLGVAAIAIFYLAITPIGQFTEKHFGYNIEDNSIISRLTRRNPEADSFSWRGEVLKGSVPIIKSQPVLGYGYGTFPLIWAEKRPPERQNDDSAEAHNDYLRLAVETGIVGITFYVLFLTQIVAAAIRKLVKEKYKLSDLVFFSSLVVFAIVSVSDNMLHHTPVMWMIWSYWGAVFAAQYKFKSPNFL